MSCCPDIPASHRKSIHNQTVGIKGDLNKKGVFASTGLRERRNQICKACESFKAGLCVECGCVVALKTRIWSSECPQEKWSKSYVRES